LGALESVSKSEGTAYAEALKVRALDAIGNDEKDRSEQCAANVASLHVGAAWNLAKNRCQRRASATKRASPLGDAIFQHTVSQKHSSATEQEAKSVAAKISSRSGASLV
jgi:hypothetical protein